LRGGCAPSLLYSPLQSMISAFLNSDLDWRGARGEVIRENRMERESIYLSFFTGLSQACPYLSGLWR